MYKKISIVVFSLIFLFFAINILLGIVYFTKDHIMRNPFSYHGRELFTNDGKPLQNGQRTPFQLDWFDYNACKEIGKQYASDVLDDFYQIKLQDLSPREGVLFSYPQFRGKKTNIILGERGFPRRKTINPERSNNNPVVRIYALGSSTTLGTFVSDEHTWPSYLSQILNDRAKQKGKPYSIEVVNFGRGGYYLSQEALLIFNLLRSGHRPSLVIFLDGFNWGEYEDDVPTLTTKLTDEFLSCYYYKSFSPECIKLSLQFLPIYRLFHSIKTKFETLLNQEQEESIKNENPTEKLNNETQIILKRLDLNRDLISAICSVYGANALFFWEPHPMYKYNLDLFRPDLKENLIAEDNEAIVKMVYERVTHNKEIIDLSNLYEKWGEDKKAFVDDYHFSPEFNKFLAKNIAEHINLDELKIIPEIFNESKSPDAVKPSIINNDF